MSIYTTLSAALSEKGYQYRLVSTSHLLEVNEEITGFANVGCFANDFYNERLTGFTYRPPASLPDAQSIILVAMPQPKIRITFIWCGEHRDVYMPPTYLSYINNGLENLIASVLNPNGYHLAHSTLPLKHIAVHSGLGAYGRNNICYISGMGSFARLAAFFSDLPCEDDIWMESRTLDRCKKCTACITECPTGAITTDRFLLHAERCLTFINEGSPDFPTWIDPSWHHCIVGCMRCQSICPENKQFLTWVENMEYFLEIETTSILHRIPINQLFISTVEKLIHLDLVGYYDILSRNLSALLSKSDAKPFSQERS